MKMDVPPKKEDKKADKNNYVKLPYIYSETNVEKEKRMERDREWKEYEDNYVPNLSSLGFEYNALDKPERWIPDKETQKEAWLINTADFQVNEILVNTINDDGSIKNGGELFRDLFVKKISPILGNEFAENCLRFNWYIPWKEEEMLNGLCNLINNPINKKDIDKIIVIKFIKDIILDMAQANDQDGIPNLDSFLRFSLITRFKNKDVNLLEKCYLREVIYKIFNFDSNEIGNHRFFNDTLYQKDLSFLNKEIGEDFDYTQIHNKEFDKYKIEFNKKQLEKTKGRDWLYPNEEIRPVDFYKDANIDDIYKKNHLLIDANIDDIYKKGHLLVNECYITSYLAPGVIGFYSFEGILVGWKNVSEMSEHNLNYINDISEIKKKKQISLEELALFEVSSSLGFRNDIQNILKINLSELNLNNQFYFLNFIQGKTEDDLMNFKKFINNSKNEKEKIINLKTFLSIEQGGKEMGDKILTLAEKLPQEIAEKVFLGYQKIINTADNVQKILEEILPEKVLVESPNEIIEIKDSLLIRAKNLLVNFYDKKENNPENLIKDLERYKSEVLLYADTYKKLNQSGKEIKLEDIKNTQISMLSQVEKEESAKNFWNITKANRPFIKSGSEELINREINFNQTIKNENSDFYVLKHKGEVIAFCSFTPDENGNFYAESLNIESEIKGAQIGSEFFPAVLGKIKAKGKDIYGHVHPLNSGILPYYERLGFEIKEVREGQDLKYYEIRIPAQNISKLVA